jgi:outer membrane protein TolC
MSRAQDRTVDGTMPEDYLPGLKSILGTALKRSPEMIKNEIYIAQGEAGVYQYNHQLWPSVNGSANYGTIMSGTTGGASNTQTGLFYSFGVNQPIFQWGALANQSRIGHINLLIDQKNYDEAYRNLAIALREQYFSLILKELAVRNARFNLKLAQAALDVLEERLKSGAVSPAEIGPPRLDTEEARLGLERVEEDLENSKREFARIAGIDKVSDAEIPEAIPKPIYDPNAAEILLATLLRDHAESTFQAQVYELDIRHADLDYSIAKVQLLPKVSAAATYQVQNQTTAFNNQVSQTAINQLSYNINAQWTIFDGLATRGAKLQALAEKRLNQRMLKNYVETTENEAQHLEKQLDITARYQELTDQRWKMQDDALKQTQDQLKRGMVAPNAVDAARAAWYALDYNNMSARADYLAQWNEFVSLVGRDPALDNLPPRYARDIP